MENNSNSASISQSVPLPNLNTHLSFGNIDVTNLDIEEVVNVIMLTDTSQSMNRFVSELNFQRAEFIRTMQNMHQAPKIFCSMGRFDSDIEVLTGFQQVNNISITPLKAIGSSTRLYDACLEFIKNAMSQQQLSLNAGILTKTIFSVITDGADNASKSDAAAEIRKIMDFIQNDEAIASTFTSALVGIGDNYIFEKAQKEMNIKNLFVFDPNLTPKELSKQIKEVFFDGWLSASVSSASTYAGPLIGGF